MDGFFKKAKDAGKEAIEKASEVIDDATEHGKKMYDDIKSKYKYECEVVEDYTKLNEFITGLDPEKIEIIAVTHNASVDRFYITTKSEA